MEINTDATGEYVNVPASAITRAIATDGTNSKSALEGATEVTRPELGQNHNQRPIKLTLSTYEDENGDPCSAV